MTADLADRCRGPFEQAIKDWGKDASAIDHVILVGGSTRMPMIQELVRELTGGKEPHKGVNPDEVVAVGAAIQAGVLKGDVKDILLLDVTPLSLGVETKGGLFTKLIERNTTIPTRKSEIFTTADDNQTTVEIHVLQGEAETVMSPGVKSLGRFHLTGIPPAPRGVPQIEVAFDIDANGIVNVSAKDLATGKEQAMTITGGTALSKDEIDRMMKEAEAFAAEDHKRREAAEARNQADQLTYQVETFLKDNGDKLPDADKAELTSKNDELKQALKDESTETETAALDQRGADAGLAEGEPVDARAGRAGAGCRRRRRRGGLDAEGRGSGRRRRRRRRRDRRRRRLVVTEGSDRDEHDETGGPPSRGDDERAAEETARDVADAFDSRPADEAADTSEDPAAEAAGYRDHLQRLQAEFDNYRKRVLREQTTAVEQASRPVFRRLLEVLDDFDLALMHAQDRPDFDRFLHGVELVYAKLLDTLRAEGLEQMDAQGKPFDPENHEALMQTGDGEGDPVVADVLRPGYTLKGRVLRPAGVRVERK